MTNHTRGTFDVKTTPVAMDLAQPQAATVGRFSLDKQWTNNFTAT